MDIEFEATFIDIDPEHIRERLRTSGANCLKPETLMRRVVFFPPREGTGGWLRVRDEGDVITMSLKEVTGNKIEDQKEIMLRIHDFTSGVKMLEALGSKKKAYQETKRETWLLNEVEITIDTWPGLKPFVEVEGKSEQSVKETSAILGLNYEQALFGSVDLVYQKQLGIPPEVINMQTPEITFENPPKKYQL
jgi:adenylate cyclase class 2